MGAWDYIKGAASDVYDTVKDRLGGVGADDIFGSRIKQADAYASQDRSNYDLPGYQQFQDRYSGYLGNVDNRQAPQIGAYERAQQSGVAQQQQGLAGLLDARAHGLNSVAEQQMRQAADQSFNQQASLAAGARPGSQAMAMRLAGQNQGRTMSGLGQQAGVARAAEAQQAAMGLGNLYGQMRGADENLGQFNAAMNNQRQLEQARMGQQQTAMDDQARAGLLAGSLAAGQAQQQGGMGYEGGRTQRFGAVLGVPTTQEQILGAASGVANAAAAGGAFSDERLKTGVRPGDQEADRFLGTLSPHAYSLKGSARLPGEPQGQTLGVMAQNVRRSPMGKEAVGQADDGMFYLDPRRMTTAMAAGLGRVDERLRALEGRR